MEELQLYSILTKYIFILWYPFVRIFTSFTFISVIGDNLIPTKIKFLVSIILSIIILPSLNKINLDFLNNINFLSWKNISLTIEQIAIGSMLGLAFRFANTILQIFAFLCSSQTSLAMAQLNDPINNNNVDILSIIMNIFGILLFFIFDLHLLLINILGKSFEVWQINLENQLFNSFNNLNFYLIIYNLSWIFSASFLLATPIIFGALIIQLGFGFLTRAAPSINIFSLGFSLVTLFGIIILLFIFRNIPEHYRLMTDKILNTLAGLMNVK